MTAVKTEWSRLMHSIAKPAQFVQILTISPACFADNVLLETIQFYSIAFWQQHKRRLKVYTVPYYIFTRFTFAGILYKEKQHGSKYTIVRYLRSLMLKPSILQSIYFKPYSLRKIINSAHQKKFIFLHIYQNEQITVDLPEFHAIICLKIASIANDDGRKKVDDKLDVEILISDERWRNFSIFQKLNLFAWRKQFADHIQSFKWNTFSDTVSGFYYQSQFRSLPKTESVAVSVENLQLGPNTAKFNFKNESAAFLPYMVYNSIEKGLPNLSRFLRKTGCFGQIHFLPLAHVYYSQVLSQQIQQKLLVEYKAWVESGVSGHHEFARTGKAQNSPIYRIKSYVHKRYWYKSQEYKKQVKEYKKKRIKLATDNVGEGLRIIPNDPKPPFLLNLWTILPMLPQPEYFDQIGFVLYMYSGVDAAATFSGISAHDEWSKFFEVWQLSVGKDCILTIDGGGGDVNATVGLEISAGSLIHHDMNSYFQSASKVTGSGCKHSISRRHCILWPGESRLTILFRRCQSLAVQSALKHLTDCQNNDFECFCLNPNLKTDEVDDVV